MEIVDKLEDKMGLISLLLTMAYEAKVNYTDVFGQVKYWDILIYNFLRKRKIAIPQKASHRKEEQYEGEIFTDNDPDVRIMYNPYEISNFRHGQQI